ncbi:MAG: beta-galactosidase trimerization domain-containing protein [Planctomycetia bacterium]|nr:beta-galactosidase trimerization domain-containing protein [Planctomycetia bacterium]
MTRLPLVRFSRASTWITFVCATLFVVAPAPAQKPRGGLDDDLTSDILSDLKGKATTDDLDGLRDSHLTLLASWEGVEPLDARRKSPGKNYRWKEERGFVSPREGQPISTLIDVPKPGTYRIYLRHWIGIAESHPATATLEPLRREGTAEPATYASAGAAASHTFGKVRLIDNALGKEQERKLPIRFESEVQLNTLPDRGMFVWEYWELKLPTGPQRLSLASNDPTARIDAVFLTPSLTFRPSFSEVKKDNTLAGVFLRYRVLEGAKQPVSFHVNLTYHWAGRRVPSGTEPLWYDSVPGAAKVPATEWSPFIDVREQILPGGGPWSTWRTSFTGLERGKVEVQLAWYPHPASVVGTLQTAVGDKWCMFRMPHGSFHHRESAAAAMSGVWNKELIAAFIPEEAIVEKYFSWAEEAARTLGVKADHPKPKHIHVLSSCRTGPAHIARAAEMLAKLGVNWVPGAPRAVNEKYDLFDDAQSKKVKLGDEISTHTAAATINADPFLRAGFHDYLREQVRLLGTDLRTFFGVDDLRHVDCLDVLPDDAGRFERRLFYCSQRYCHVATIPHYARLVKAVEKKTPGAQIYNNYSPHPLFLTGRDMNGSDWFLLPRAGAQTLGWGEDWATGGSWGLNTPATECTTFYAAIVECGVRTRGYPAGFYVGSNCGYSAQKMFSCVSQGISILHLYDWGPIDAWAEGSNAWSEMEGQYLSVMQGTHALGPADEIVGKGKREPRRTAILYNRSHEIVSGKQVWLNRDWMWTFLGLRNSQIPVDVVIEEDLTDATLASYQALFIGGLNLERRHLAAVRRWVEQGGLLIGSAGAALDDVYGDRMPETVELFGAAQRLATVDDTKSRTRIMFDASDEYAAIDLPAAAAGDQKYILTPTTGKLIARYDGGEGAVVVNALGRGRTILLGVTTGETFRVGGGAKSPARAWLAAPVLRQLGRSQTEFDCPESEVTRFDHASGTAVLIAIYTSKPEELSKAPGRLSVQVDRPVREVTSALHGPLKWELHDGRIEIETPPPAAMVVDSIILR